MAQRRAGQIIPKGRNKWVVRAFLGRDVKGKRRYHNKMVHGTQKDAQAYLNKVLRDQDLGTFVEPSAVPFAEYLAEWLQQSVRPRVAPRSAG